MKAIILNSGMGTRLGDLTANNPKSLVHLNEDETICSRAISILSQFDIDEFVITTGYLNNVLKVYLLENFPNLNFQFVHNSVYDKTNYIKSIDLIDEMNDDIILLHGDLVFTKETAEKVIKELNKGKKFEDLAKKYSKDESNASKGGSLGYFDVATMVDEFAEAVKALKVDEYTKEPVKTEFGYHVILKTGEKEKPKLSEVEDKIKERLTNQKLNENNYVYYETLKAIREKNKISWNDDILKDTYNNYMDQLIENAKQQ